MRITLLIEQARVDDAAIVLETLGFVPEITLHPEPPQDGGVRVTGEFPDGKLPELELIDGIRDWFIPPAEETSGDGGLWTQKPETD